MHSNPEATSAFPVTRKRRKPSILAYSSSHVTDCLSASLGYLGDGLRPIPLHARGEPIFRGGISTSATGKEPIGDHWGRRAHTQDSLNGLFDVNHRRGVGLQLGLGPNGEDGIFDLEIDDREMARATLSGIFGRPEPPETRRFDSRRGTHYLYRLTAADAARLVEAGVTQATIDGKNFVELRGVELRFGTLNPANPKEVQSVAPPTPYYRDDGVMVPRRWEGPGFAPFPTLLMTYLITRFGRRADRRTVPPPTPPRHLDLSPIELFLHQLELMGLEYAEAGDGWMAQCPAHLDNTPSLNVSEAEHGPILVHCFGCGATYPEIMAAVGLTPRDGFLDEISGKRSVVHGLSGDPRSRTDLSWVCDDLDEEAMERIDREHTRCVRALEQQPEKREELCRRLGISPSTSYLLGVGWREDREKVGDKWVGTGRWAWVFPEVDGRRRVVGLLRRYEDESHPKRLVARGCRGLTVPAAWRKRRGPIILCEGASDTAALLEEGYCAIGRPQAQSRSVLRYLAELLEDDPREIMVAADNDEVGRRGAEELAQALGAELYKDVLVLPPLPPGIKDLRHYLAS